MDFHNTRRGADFFDYQFPEMVRTLKTISKSLDESNHLKSRELLLKEKELELREQELILKTKPQESGDTK